ncbi:hypothetical protein EPH_0028840 [Eimeria praecox]|uniref:Aminopeptidase N n=1 Tax=Eimeria praecox TaxID=51316 RepID=U6G104_9EIME|nr:hypothetical protein EPH_0028840 [Eimeria praecox]
MHMRFFGAVASLGAVFVQGLQGVQSHAVSTDPPLLLSSLFSSPSWRQQPAVLNDADAASPASLWGSLLQQLPHVGGAHAAAANSRGKVEEERAQERSVAVRRETGFNRKQYKALAYDIDAVELTFKLDEDETEVQSHLRVRRREGTEPEDLILDGEDLNLQSVALDDTLLENDPIKGYSLLEGGQLKLPKAILPQNSGKRFFLTITVKIYPKENLQLSGLYWSDGVLVTQCEPEGYRRIMYGYDRPDSLSRYLVRLEADKKKYPVLLSNGNKVAEGPITGHPERHFALYEDPFPKSTYLFAIVAGDFGSIGSRFRTMSGRDVSIQLYSPPQSVGYLEYAKVILQESMKWDEKEFGREYDLDTLNVVCVNDFNGGAMENKGLLIFNCRSLLTDPKISTDLEFTSTVASVSHEYFHNWTGNRVTIRDWSELWLKEGLTTFREQLFRSSWGSADAHRIEDAKRMITLQFREDLSPLSTPLRPDSYDNVDNLYSRGVYWKGSEVINMYRTVMGPDNFRRGMDMFFRRYDGVAVTSEEFTATMSEASDTDLSIFDLWYQQSGIPKVRVTKVNFDGFMRTFTVTLEQIPATITGQPAKQPLAFPVAVGLIGRRSKTDVLNPPTQVVLMTQRTQTFRFSGVREDCAPSVLRGFSAPVELLYEQSLVDLAFLMNYDTDPVNRWRAGQAYARKIIVSRVPYASRGLTLPPLDKGFLKAFEAELVDSKTDNAVKALTLRLPDAPELGPYAKLIDPEGVHAARRSVQLDLVAALKTTMLSQYKRLRVGGIELFDQENISRRRLRNELLGYLCSTRDAEAAKLAYDHYVDARCMSDKYSALQCLSHMQRSEREMAFDAFYEEAQGNPQLMDQWFRLQAGSDLPDLLERVELLLKHPEFSYENPDRFRAVFGVLAEINEKHFHRSDGKGYRMMTEAILKVDKFNSSLAASTAKYFSSWRDYTANRQNLMRQQLRVMKAEANLSAALREVILRSLGEY